MSYLKNVNILLISLLFLQKVSGKILFWSTKKLSVSPLIQFDDHDLNELLNSLDNPKLLLYEAQELFPDLESYLTDNYSAFNFHGDINVKNATEIKCAKEIGPMPADGNYLAAVYVANKRNRKKRQINEDAPNRKGPVLYRGKSVKDSKYALLYSPNVLELRTNESRLFLGNTSKDLITVDTVSKDTFTRLSVSIPQGNGYKITMRFLFHWRSNGYWLLRNVIVSDNDLSFTYNLSAPRGIQAPRRFSYHCSNGPTVFRDWANNATLVFDTIQVQIDSMDGRFGDAYDCVPFMTATIGSGILVMIICITILIASLNAISNIKTMDKFDNHATKHLVITLSE